MKKIDQIIELLIEIRDNTKPAVKKERTQAVGEGLPPIAKIWNEWAHKNLPRVIAMAPSGTRYRNCMARWNEHPKKEFWVAVIERLNKSSFCIGFNDRKWVADIDFLTRPDSCHRILEGKHDDKPSIANREQKVAGYILDGEGKMVPVMG